MTDLFAVATGNWSSTGTWSLSSGGSPGAGPPTSADRVFLNAATGVKTITIDGTTGSPSLCQSLDCTGFTGTLTASGTGKQVNVGDANGGNFKLVSGMTFAFPTDAASFWNFISTHSGNTMDWGGKQTSNMVFNGVGGSWLLQSNTVMFAGTAPFMTLTNGTLDMNGFNLTAINFTSNTGGTRVFNMGSGTFTNNGGFSVGNLSTGLTINGGTSTFSQPFNSAGPTMGDQTYHDYSQGNAGAYGPTITGTPTFNNFTLPSVNVSSSFSINGGITVNGTLTMNGNVFSQNTRLFVHSAAYGVQANIVCNGTVTAQYLNLKDIAASGSASWNLSAITGLSGDCGNNSGITFTTPATVFAKMTTSGNIDGLPWKTTSGGSVVARVPLPQDTGKFDANAFSTGSIVVTNNVARIGALDFTGATNTPTLNINASTELYGDLTLISAMTLSGTSALNFEGGAGTTHITTAGKSIPWPMTFGSNRTISPLDAITSTNTLIVYDYCTFNTNGFNHQFSAITFSGGTTNVNDNLKSTGAVTVDSAIAPAVINLAAQLWGTGAVAVSSGTINSTGNSAELKSGTTMAFSGGTSTIDKLTIGSTLTASGGTLKLPAATSHSFATGFNVTNAGAVSYGGVPTFSAGALTIAATAPPNLGI
jgi:hypothetical protein